MQVRAQSMLNDNLFYHVHYYKQINEFSKEFSYDFAHVVPILMEKCLKYQQTLMFCIESKTYAGVGFQTLNTIY